MLEALYPFRTMIEKSKSSLAHNITGVLRMEEWKVHERVTERKTSRMISPRRCF